MTEEGQVKMACDGDNWADELFHLCTKTTATMI